jgi:eukaryotic-like serine/threonine-protein kinase
MTPERWHKIKELLGPALDMDPTRQSAYLNGMCADDSSLRSEVEQLLVADRNAGSQFLQVLAIAEESEGKNSQHGADWIGRRLGPYQIVEKLGVGGMGEVFRALRIDQEYEKEVAVKLVRRTAGADFVIERFKNERQILANLDHPNIARLLDGGTTEEGCPYLVMELVRGERIDKYCEARRLFLTERLTLFLKVCAAVQYAHQRLVIHRDIKPSNILVTTDGVPKLLDFGIAKITEPDDANDLQPTITVFRLLTPAYASPEQIQGEMITTASDVYSLGVVLYELLTGLSPYSNSSGMTQELARAACEREPQKPSLAVGSKRSPQKSSTENTETSTKSSALREALPENLSRRLRGDLDNIVMMALRKEPGRRYVSVEQFAGDIRRHLAHLPVVARNDTLRYRTSKFLTRHKPSVTAAAMVLLTLIVAIALTLRQARIAERRFNDVRKLANSLVFEIHDSIKDLPGATPVRQLLVNRALEYLDGLSQEAGNDDSLQGELAAAYERVGDVQGNPYYPNLGDVNGALRSYRKSVAIRERLLHRNPGSTALRRELSGSYTRLGAALDGAKDFAGALTSYRKALNALSSVTTNDADALTRDRLAGAHYYVAIASVETGNISEALQNASEAASIRESIYTDDPSVARLIQTHLAGDYGSMAQILASAGEWPSAMAKQRQALDLLISLAQQHPGDATLQSFLGEAQFYSGVILEQNGRLDEALDNCEKAKQIFESLLSTDPKNAFAQQYLGLSYEVSGRLHVLRGKPGVGLTQLTKATLIFEGLGRKDSRNAETLTGFGESYLGMGLAYSELARRANRDALRIEDLLKAREWYQKSLEIWQELRSRNSLDPLDRNRPEELAKAIGECDQALAGFSVRRH